MISGLLLVLGLICFTGPYVSADVYMHNPRGSNNRCDRRTNDRANANRLFDSQNNAAGGYAVPCDRPLSENINCYKMRYYEGSELDIRWTVQHNCGILNNCEVNLQYSCEDENLLGNSVRDGKPQNINGNTCEDILPNLPDAEIQNNEKYGKHEDYGYYQRCIKSLRNPRLFTADQKLRGTSAQYTRQNPNGARYGFECPEERDYYPYWRDSPWIDIAVITNRAELCDIYKNATQNMNDRVYCVGAAKFIFNISECDEYGGQIISVPSFRKLNMPVSEPDCVLFKSSPPSNRLSEANEHNTQSYKWILPKITQNMTNCILRVRYNISSNEVPFDLNSEFNGGLKNNPQINTTFNVPVRLAIDTSQYGRTFEDRSFTFDIIKRGIPINNKIINVNVQGKRGNIAQIRNCVEYDFVPNNITINSQNGEYLHFQWVGSDYNPVENEGEGRVGTDRSNLVLIDDIKSNWPASGNQSIFTIDTLIELASIGQPYQNTTLCKFPNNDEQSLDNCALLNYAPPYFNLLPVKINNITGNMTNYVYYAMSSRNNNFSNRDQKIVIMVMAKNNTISAANEKIMPQDPNDNKEDSMARTSIISYSFLGVILFIIAVCLIICIRKNSITFAKITKKIRLNFASEI